MRLRTYENINHLRHHIKDSGKDYLFLTEENIFLKHHLVDSRDDCVNIESLTKKR